MRDVVGGVGYYAKHLHRGYAGEVVKVCALLS